MLIRVSARLGILVQKWLILDMSKLPDMCQIWHLNSGLVTEFPEVRKSDISVYEAYSGIVTKIFVSRFVVKGQRKNQRTSASYCTKLWTSGS